MKYRKFGKMGWEVSALGHGMWGMGDWTGSDDKESLRALHRTVELGINFFDTAWIYGNGRSEKLLGKLLRAYPNECLYTATKIPPKNFKWPMEPQYTLDETFPAKHMIEYVEKSLKNFGIDHIDLIQLHGWDDVWALDPSWQKAAEDLKRRGLVGAFGISIDRWEPENAIKAIKTGAVDSLQVIYNIFDQAPEDKLFPVCRKYNVAVIARVPLDEGTLTGTLTLKSKWPEGDWRNKYFNKETLKASVEHAGKLKKVLPKGMAMSELALRFILSNRDVSTTIPGMRKRRHVEENAGAGEKGKLAKQLIKKLRSHRWDRRPTPSAG
ncbi:aldo/keto reductase [Candidatus Woesebacteria bacterium RIFCSPHIGHO2_02_FULL_42_20]|uniref:Aldo/keto reductase n=1 Tax=Candidatus Woesebacteria bacterium RIFCSPHIGHO2_12_FULL_41_24 TaxID=1802510 RepID=A0A1F8ARS5_9BACT|nr:MAG: aldo/keto reductase [Candidatus Woesebacteria bacterium RBG_16_41_13]OGM29386.1 MAG: aldo/keto reductase [Candidatus Woesebacteria bacterium RIFCSPHIGHO2_01_FULL_42_80]OGM34835.1 MAG: aldo/keto reductase [Candidatus Woesebacteria bacterium RIFCSPHIGHO2_02_FULL_42_20]OGM54464.1 MAG: aldo/keto reductase [Candidatus Woesebacteria bacterium RIFCSPHIGHO2_12_FULL_41_24]OGM71775.1 MAG: aldo/keto reductase [Candidatus Woesebacteria bacterium RIFCSPLOWO2_02_FULL_42_10]OGM72572.1 MAG: aldo/keto 